MDRKHNIFLGYSELVGRFGNLLWLSSAMYSDALN